MKKTSQALLAVLSLIAISLGYRAEAAGTQALYENSSQAATWLKYVANAQRSIDIEIYQMGDPYIRQLLRYKLAQHVRIRIVKEPTPFSNVPAGHPGAPCYYFEAGTRNLSAPLSTDSPGCQDEKKLMAQIVQAGGAVAPYNKDFCPSWDAGRCVEHGKAIIIDGTSALISTGNLDASNLCDLKGNPDACNRDYTVYTTDPNVVTSVENIFQGDLVGQPYNVLAAITPGAQNTLTVSPYSTQPLVNFILGTQSYIMVQNQYLHEANINAALMQIARAGKKVYVNVASFCAFSRPGDQDKNASDPKSEAGIFTAFDAAGIQSRIFTSSQIVGTKPGYLHAKAMIRDGNAAWVGSVNGSAPATSANREFGIFFTDPTMVNHLATVMRYDLADERGETWQESLQCLRDSPRSGAGD